VQPLLGTVLAVILIKETISTSFIYAAVLVLTGVTLVSWKQSS
jgi:drug/metabolite transporter (DMT)-like permease